MVGGGGDGWGRGGGLVTGNSGFTSHELETWLAENHAVGRREKFPWEGQNDGQNYGEK